MPNKKISELNENINPSGSDIFPVVHNGETMKQTLSGLTNYISDAETERVDFYTIDYVTSDVKLHLFEPLTNIAETTAPFLFKAFGQPVETRKGFTGTTRNFYSNFLFEIIEENGIHVKDLQFTGLTELQSYLTANLTSGTTIGPTTATSYTCVVNPFTVKMYAYKKKSYQSIKKVRGVNMFFSVLRGRRSYWRNKIQPSVDTQSIRNNSMYASSRSPEYVKSPIADLFIKRVYDRFGIDKDIPVDDNIRKTIWYPADRKEFYNLPPVATGLINNNGWSAFNGGSTTRLAVDSHGSIYDAGGQYTEIVDSAIFLLNEGGSGFCYTSSSQLDNGDIFDQDGVNISGNFTFEGPAISKMYNDGVTSYNYISAIRVYKLFASNGTYAFWVKPIGVDTLLVDYIEDNQDAILYGMFNSEDNGRQLIARFDDNTKVNDKQSNTSWRLLLDDYEFYTLDKVTTNGNFEPGIGNQQMKRYGSNNFRNRRLFYGYPDGTISDIGVDQIYHIAKSRGAWLKRMVRKTK